MTDFKWYCPWCDYFLEDAQVKGIDDNDPCCQYCNHPVDSEQDPNEGTHDTLEEKYL